jgi:hypothetical protein
MVYDEFCEEVCAVLAERYSADGWGLRRYTKGDVGKKEHDIAFINRTNMKYYGRESDVLGGDFLEMFLGPEFDPDMYCRFELQYLHSKYIQGGWDRVYEAIDYNLDACLDSKYYLNHIREYDEVRDRLIVRLLNYKNNEEALEGKIYWKVGDFVLALYLVVRFHEFDTISCKVDEEMLDEWGIPEFELMNLALYNSNIYYPPRVYTTFKEAVRQKYSDGAFMKLGDDTDLTKDMGVSIFACHGTVNGAIGFFYPGVMKRISQMVGDRDYYVVFDSTGCYHIYICDEIKLAALQERLISVNARIPDKEKVSDMVWRYDCQKHRLISDTQIIISGMFQ